MGSITAVAGRVIENAQADVIETVVFEYLKGVFFYSLVAKLHTPVFELRQEGDVGAQHFVYRLCHRSAYRVTGGGSQYTMRCARLDGYDVGGTGVKSVCFCFEADHGTRLSRLHDDLAVAIEKMTRCKGVIIPVLFMTAGISVANAYDAGVAFQRKTDEVIGIG